MAAWWMCSSRTFAAQIFLKWEQLFQKVMLLALNFPDSERKGSYKCHKVPQREWGTRRDGARLEPLYSRTLQLNLDSSAKWPVRCPWHVRTGRHGDADVQSLELGTFCPVRRHSWQGQDFASNGRLPDLMASVRFVGAKCSLGVHLKPSLQACAPPLAYLLILFSISNKMGIQVSLCLGRAQHLPGSGMVKYASVQARQANLCSCLDFCLYSTI